MTLYEQMSAWHARVQGLAKAKPYRHGEERTRTDGSVWKKPEDGGDLVMVRGPERSTAWTTAPRRQPSKLRAWATSAVWGGGHQDWPDDHPAAPWNEPIRWLHASHDGAQWVPSAYGRTVALFRVPHGFRRGGVKYQLRSIMRDGNRALADTEVASDVLMDTSRLDDVRDYLRDYWRLNHPSSGMALAALLRKQDAAAAKDRAAEAERARQREEEARHAEWFKRDQATKVNRIAADRASGRWMETGHDHHMHRLKPVQRTALLDALQREGLGLEDSWDVHDRAIVKRSATGGTWPDAYQFAAMKIRNLREA